MAEKQTKLPQGAEELPKPEGANSIEFWKPAEVGESLTGEITAISDGTYGKYLTIKQDSGNLIGTPSHKALQAYIPMLQIGQRVHIVFEKFYKTKNGTGQDYKVYKIK